MARRHLGQNFLFDTSILSKIIEASRIEETDTVVEIGPGHGKLTELLIAKVGRVITIEIDRLFSQPLMERYADYGNVDVIEGDALKYDYESLGPFKIVANIPYYITTPLIFRFLKARHNLLSMTLTIQKEVAERIVALPNRKDYGALSVAVQYYGSPEIAFIIPKEAFRPIPKVDSAVIRVDIYKKPPVNVGDERLFFKIVRAAFSQRRKVLSNSLRPIFPDIKDILQGLGIDSLRRAETLSLEEFAALSRTIGQRSKIGA
jgi:16S rRNA (adenine1518-N6/adenine1519-N6)-dimethyltransferase